MVALRMTQEDSENTGTPPDVGKAFGFGPARIAGPAAMEWEQMNRIYVLNTAEDASSPGFVTS